MANNPPDLRQFLNALQQIVDSANNGAASAATTAAAVATAANFLGALPAQRVIERLDRLEQTVNRRMGDMNLQLQKFSQWSIARATNAQAVAGRAALVPPQVIQQDAQGNSVLAAPPGFPATRAALFELERADIGPLLTAYGLPANGTLKERKKTLAHFVGVRPTDDF
jgi:hypothetical protein